MFQQQARKKAGEVCISSLNEHVLNKIVATYPRVRVTFANHASMRAEYERGRSCRKFLAMRTNMADRFQIQK